MTSRTAAPLTRRASKAAAQTTHRTDIQGLRAFAVGAVLLAHAGIPGAAGGFIGVDVFFVISGFLITSLLIREVQRTGTVSIRKFYERRARRILPAGTVVILAVLASAVFTLPAGRILSVAADAVWSAFFAANVHFALEGADYFADDTSPLQHFWSLAVEEQFYVIWPLIVLAAAVLIRRRLRPIPVVRLVTAAILVIIVASVIWSVIETATSPATAYFSTFSRAYELGGGALLACLTAAGTTLPAVFSGVVRAVLGWVGLGVLVALVMLWDETARFPGIAALAVTAATMAVITAGIGDGAAHGAGRLLSVQPLRFIGDISYSLYLWHWPLLTGGLLSEWDPAPRTIILIATSVLLATLSYYLIERPFQRGRVRMPKRGGSLLLWPLSVLVIVTAALGSVVVANNSTAQAQEAAAEWYDEHGASSDDLAPDGASALQNIEARISRALEFADHGAPLPPDLNLDEHAKDVYQEKYSCTAFWDKSELEICPVGNVNADNTVVVVGDSHAGSWIASLDVLGQEQGFRVIPLIKPGCNVYDISQWFAEMPESACNDFTEWARAKIAELHPSAVVVSARGFDAMHTGTAEERDAAWRAGVESGVRALTPLTERVFVFADVPLRSSDATDCLTQRDASAAACVADAAGGVSEESNVLAQQAAESAGATWVDITPLLCSPDLRCPLVVGNTITYFDDNHLTMTWGREVAPALGEMLGMPPRTP